MLARGFTPDSGSILERAIWIHPIVIIGNTGLKRRVKGRVTVIIDYIKNHSDTSIMIGLNQGF